MGSQLKRLLPMAAWFCCCGPVLTLMVGSMWLSNLLTLWWSRIRERGRRSRREGRQERGREREKYQFPPTRPHFLETLLPPSSASGCGSLRGIHGGASGWRR